MLFVIELCFFGEQMCLDNTRGADMRVSTRRKTHKQKQLNYDEVNLFVSLTCIQEVFRSNLRLLPAIPLPGYKIGCKNWTG